MEESKNKGRVCVTGGTGFVGSWMVKRLLEDGYSVNTTIRTNPNGSKKDISFLTNLPGATEKLKIFIADLENPDSFHAAIEGCIGVFHVAHPIDYEGKEPEEQVTNESVGGMLGILEACLSSKTVKKVVYTSSAATVFANYNGSDVLDEGSWIDIDFVRKANFIGASYSIAKTLTEKAALDFAERNSLDVVTVIPPWIHGPFICPSLPGSVGLLLEILKGGSKHHLKFLERTNFVHVDDLARAHIFLFEHPEAKGRYICSSVEIKTDKLLEFLYVRYPEYRILSADSLIDREVKFSGLSSKKLLDTGFVFKYGLVEMFDGAIECCKQKGIL